MLPLLFLRYTEELETRVLSAEYSSIVPSDNGHVKKQRVAARNTVVAAATKSDFGIISLLLFFAFHQFRRCVCPLFNGIPDS